MSFYQSQKVKGGHRILCPPHFQKWGEGTCPHQMQMTPMLTCMPSLSWTERSWRVDKVMVNIATRYTLTGVVLPPVMRKIWIRQLASAIIVL